MMFHILTDKKLKDRLDDMYQKGREDAICELDGGKGTTKGQTPHAVVTCGSCKHSSMYLSGIDGLYFCKAGVRSGLCDTDCFCEKGEPT